MEVLLKFKKDLNQSLDYQQSQPQPVAGAQGELVRIKMFQTYHQSKGESRDIILVKSAHGTNPATRQLQVSKPIKRTVSNME